MIPLRGVLTTFGCFLLHLSLGTGNTFGNMSPYIMSYIRHFGDNLNDSSVHGVIWIYAMVCVGHGLFVVIGGLIGDKIGPRIITFIGCVIMSTGVVTSYFAIKSSLILLTLTYGVLFGIGVGTAYPAPLFAGMMWFPNNKGLVNGIIIAGFGMSSFIFTQVQTFYINPENISPNEAGYFTDAHMLERIPKIFLFLGATYFAMQIIGCSLLSHPDVNIEEKCSILQMKTCSDESSTEHQYNCLSLVSEDKSYQPIISEICQSPKEIVRLRQFYILWITYFLNNQINFYILSSYKVYGQTFIKDDKYLAMIGAIGAIFNSSGRLVWGYLCDKYNFKLCMSALTSTICAVMATLSLTSFGGKFMFAIWLWLICFTMSGNYVLFPTYTAQVFGLKHARANYGLVFSNSIFSSVVAAFCIRNLRIYLGWFGLHGYFATISALSFLLTIFL